jgi:hypothetical protein
MTDAAAGTPEIHVYHAHVRCDAATRPLCRRPDR